MSASTKVGKYEIRGTLGKGAMGVVYQGYDPILDRTVAIKVVEKESLDPEEAPEMLARFKREAQAAARLNHPGIVSIHDYGETDACVYIAMEYIKGTELKKFFERQERFDLPRIVRIMSEILDALEHAHRNGVVHRDVKPANIMITEEGRVKVADFGVAHIESSSLTKTGTPIGTPAYMSPEQHQGLHVDGRSDIFSAGIILYQFLTGERPFTGGIYTIVQQILKQDPVLPSEVNFSIPRELDAVVSKALAKRAVERFGSAREFSEVLASVAASGQASMAARVSGAELELWKVVGESTDPADLEAFLRAYPESRFAAHARTRLERLRAEDPEKTLGPPAHEAEILPAAKKPESQVRVHPPSRTEPAAEPAAVDRQRLPQADSREAQLVITKPKSKTQTWVVTGLATLGLVIVAVIGVVIYQRLQLTSVIEEQAMLRTQVETIEAKEREIGARLAAAKARHGEAGSASGPTLEARTELAVWSQIHDLTVRHVFGSEELKRVREHIAPSFLSGQASGGASEALQALREARSVAARLDANLEPIQQVARARGTFSVVLSDLNDVAAQERFDVSRDVNVAKAAVAKSEVLLNAARFTEALEVIRQGEVEAVRALNAVLDEFVAKYSAFSERALALGQLTEATIALERAKVLTALKRKN